MASEVVKMIQLICEEKGLKYEVVMEALEQALAAAYRKDFGNRQQNIKFQYDPETGDMKAWDVKVVVPDVEEEALVAAQEEMQKRREAALAEGRELTEEETADLPRFNPKSDIMMKDAVVFKKDAALGETLEMPLEIPGDFGRMAAQTAKQVIIQKLREAERSTVFASFAGEEGRIVSGTVQRKDRNGNIVVYLGKIMAIVPPSEQVEREQYRPGMRMRFYVVKAAEGVRGPEIILSRSHNDMVRTVFMEEIPEVQNGDVQIKAIARDPGSRAKVAVFTADEGIDPVGACIGQRGSRITTVINNLGGEKIDVVTWSDDAKTFIKNALSPAKIASIELNESTHEASARVVPDQFSLAIGRGGQNVRLAAALTGWRITISEDGSSVVASSDDAPEKLETVVESADVPEEESAS